MKGITPIVGIIVLLLIVIAIAGVAYTFIFGQFTALSGKTIQAQVAAPNKIIVRNAGTETILEDEITINIEGRDAFIVNPQDISPRESTILEVIPYLAKDNSRTRVTSPTNTVQLSMDTRGSIYEGIVFIHHLMGIMEERFLIQAPTALMLI